MYDFNMNLLDIILNNRKYNEEHPNEYPKRPEEFISHYRIFGKHGTNIKLYNKTINVQKFFNNTANINLSNAYIGFLTDEFDSYDKSNIIWIEGRNLNKLIDQANHYVLKIDAEKIFHTTTELMFDMNNIGKMLTDFMISKNILIEDRTKIENLINDFFNGSDKEFYIIMNDRLDENTKYTSDGRIIVPNSNLIYSATDVDFIQQLIENKIKELRKRYLENE